MTTDIILSLARLDDVIAATAKTIARLEAELMAARTEAEGLASFREMALRFGAPAATSSVKVINHTDGAIDGKQRMPRPGSKAALIAETAESLFAHTGHLHIQTPDIAQAAKQAGIEIGGDNEPGYIASILSRDPRFVSERPHGWRLTQAVTVSESDPISDAQAGPASDVQTDD